MQSGHFPRPHVPCDSDSSNVQGRVAQIISGLAEAGYRRENSRFLLWPRSVTAENQTICDSGNKPCR
ncbi:MAG: hypothetical protein A2283_13165 [Lentisphaerae bacterium RIFOXYA12_FULL_48_11]|nr:MAG: hypothetical protein A2283_13165 [Lentisphaerae bacterium RIFOXYA12_FULL_48_11]